MTRKVRYHSMKRLETVVRIREYVEKGHYVEDNYEIDSVRMVHETYIALRDLGEYMLTANITEFSTENDLELNASMFA